MKRLFIILLSLLLLLCFIPSTVLAVGEGNVNSGGGNTGQGSSTSKWTIGNDGVRITIVDAETGTPVSASIDFARQAQSSGILHFGKTSKIQYRSGKPLALSSGSGYVCYTVANELPTIITNGGKNNIEAIKRYFCSEYTIRRVSDATGFNYDTLISGKYRLFIEPLAFLLYNGNMYCMSATEAAMYDQLANGDLRYQLGKVSHQNLPLAMFLETPDLGFAVWSGPMSGKQSNADIINYMGLGIVRFKDLPAVTGEVGAPDVEYRVDTDVITSVTLRTSKNLTPNNPASVTFHIDGRTYTVNNVVIPAGESQVVWVKWHTPSTPQTITIRVSVSGAYTTQDSFTAKIANLNEKIPPDPLATDTNPRYTVPALPSNPQKLIANWGVWSCYWVPVWVWCDHGDAGGHWIDEGYWAYDYTGYSASLSGTMSLMPDDIVPTASGKAMKSGYGVKNDVQTLLSTNAPNSHITNPQTAFSVFPEFQYKTYLRLLQHVSGGRSAKFTFQPNEYSTYNRCVHFSPLWFPDNTKFTVYTQVWDTWTPDGMLSVNLNDYVTIRGSLYDDWYTNRE